MKDVEKSEGPVHPVGEYNATGLLPNQVLMKPRQAQYTRRTCGWAQSVNACIYACYQLGWPYYQYLYVTQQCCCY